MKWLAIVLAAVWLLAMLRERGRAAGLAVLEPSEEPADDHVFLAARGVRVDEPTRRAAAAFARRNGLAAVDLVPADLATERLLGFLSMYQPAEAGKVFGQGRTPRVAALVSRALAERAGLAETSDIDPGAFIELGRQLKGYATKHIGYAVAPSLRANREPAGWRRAVLAENLGQMTPWILGAELIVLVLLGLTVALAPRWGLVALGVYHVHPLGVVLGTRLRPRDLLPTVLLRSPLAVWSWLRTVFGPRADPAADPIEERRPVYDALLRDGVGRFFEPRRETCPLCAGRELAPFLQCQDLFQHKPGRFALERCRGCGHIFQNPRLTPAGLDFYYRDFYDGLGRRQTETIFGTGDTSRYAERARMIDGHARPATWLDVGGGYGHFCLAARETWTETSFDALDQSAGIDEAERRGWIHKGYRGFFPEVCDRLQRYDVISMSHYLEHTREPEAEIAAAARVLGEGGLLLVEMPNGEARTGRLLGRYWLPFFQPQHQHMVGAQNLGRMLARHGFEPVEWHLGEAHGKGDFSGAAYLFIQHAAGPSHVPWLPRRTLLQRARYRLGWLCLFWLIPLGFAIDAAVERACRRPERANAYRVLARKTAARAA